MQALTIRSTANTTFVVLLALVGAIGFAAFQVKPAHAGTQQTYLVLYKQSSVAADAIARPSAIPDTSCVTLVAAASRKNAGLGPGSGSGGPSARPHLMHDTMRSPAGTTRRSPHAQCSSIVAGCEPFTAASYARGRGASTGLDRGASIMHDRRGVGDSAP